MLEVPIRYVQPVYRPPSEAEFADPAGDRRLLLESVHVLRNVHRAAKALPPAR